MFKKSCFALLLMIAPAFAEPPKVDHVSARQSANGTWRFDVTISHPDTGWNHYADAWRVLDMDGNQLGIRELAHPHVDEQPFTRSLSGVRIPQGVTRVQIQARDKPGGWNSQTRVFTLP
ncbi:MAG: hypothetical protein AAF999_11040 [Pseudomonadota bacterium]